MTDESGRELERRWRETGAVEDEAAWHLARTRSGELPERLLALAAYAGGEAARLALGPDAPEAPADLRDWVLGLDAWGDEVCVRVLLACARLAGGRRPETLAALERLLREATEQADEDARVAWTRDADWSLEVDWAELAAEQAWTAHWARSAEAVRRAVREAVVAWALEG